ncbi:XK- protein 8 [Saguinus oedipus]|uniref:XK-related protein n=1 Tax=Saguinus oedipus TaxID=9490 RepID=A0ABQ9VAQ2_SAGOE|nr:XK- protein 8 [Saguinus oedipus]
MEMRLTHSLEPNALPSPHSDRWRELSLPVPSVYLPIQAHALLQSPALRDENVPLRFVTLFCNNAGVRDRSPSLGSRPLSFLGPPGASDVRLGRLKPAKRRSVGGPLGRRRKQSLGGVELREGPSGGPGTAAGLAPPRTGRDGEVPPSRPRPFTAPRAASASFLPLQPRAPRIGPNRRGGGGGRSWRAMPGSSRPALLWDLVLGVLGTAAFLLDLGADLWAAVQYALGGHYLWAGLVLALLGLASVAMQLFSWLWLRGDPADLHRSQPPRRCLALLHFLQLGYLYRDAVVKSWAGWMSPQSCTTSRIFAARISAELQSDRLCGQGLQQGLLVWRQEEPSEFDLAYTDFLSLDISMLRLFETFLETAPQLTLVLAIILQSGQAEYYQWVGICTSFLGISWALLDYHRALRTCLPSKPLLGWGSSMIYFLWNLLLLWPRVLAVALFSALFPSYVALHFLGLWLVLLLWVWLQGTDFMPDASSEWLYRVTVATILYFSWFNVAEGHTRGRATIHLAFLLSDSILLVATWMTHSSWLPSEIPLQLWLSVGGGCFLLGLALRLVYYRWLHPSCHCWEPKPDQVDGARSLLSPEGYQLPRNRRMTQLAQNFFPKTKDGAASPVKGEANGIL